MTTHPLDPVLRPRSVAVVGASPDPTKRGHHAVRALIESRYPGRVVPVHPAGGTLLGLAVVRGPDELTEPVDVALVCTPAAVVPSVLEAWAAAGTRGAVVLAGGFAESGGEGATLERTVADVGRRTGMRVIGPNTSGVLNVPLGLNLIGMRGVRPGPLALLVQSGNIALQMVTAAARTGSGFSFVIGLGNEADVRFDEALDFLAGDPGTRAVLVHAEGFRDGRRLFETACDVTRHMPVALLKGGRTAAGGIAARSHTGAMAGSYETLRAALRQAGIIELLRTDEMLAVGLTLAQQPPVRGRGIAILSDGGGHATLATDTLHEHGVALPELGSESRSALRALLGRAAAVDNPIDLAGAADRDPAVFAHALRVLAADPAVGGVLVVGLFGGYAIRFSEKLHAAEVQAARDMAAAAAEHGTALVVHSLYGATRSEPLRVLERAGVPVVESLDAACGAVRALRERGLLLERLERGVATHRTPRARTPRAGPAVATRDAEGLPAEQARAAAQSAIAAARAEGRVMLLEPEARALAGAYGAPLVPGRFCATAEDAARAAEELGGNVALRVVSPATPHKTEVGGVALDVTVSDAAEAFARVAAAAEGYGAAVGRPGAVRGVMVTPMLPLPVAELLVGVVRDAQFGPVLTMGAGGVAVEVLRDVSLRVLPVTTADILEMLRELRIAPLLAGHRGRPCADLESVAAAALALVACALAHPDLREIEINPLFAYAEGAVAADVRVVI